MIVVYWKVTYRLRFLWEGQMENVKTATSSGLLPHTVLKMCLRKHVKSKKYRGNTTAFNNDALTAHVITKSESEILCSWDRA